ncbi:mitogen-activated protein kinase 15-like [Sitodiplosis mosellana]|uniref:mitogen-activated protein kinase 15-like n=1 Tax=Sitodiplosis mosellana TaxID=263140 RepID=UPI00244399FE|nr:mitogen-activated protein kinase 15-like [Sitodiplosis mosellana]
MSNKLKSQEKANRIAEIDDHIRRSFEIIKRLGKGAYGIVWKALDKRTQKIVAVKKIFDAFRNETDAQRTFREIMLLRALRNHPNIIQLYSIHRATNHMDIYLSFEFMESDLHNVIKRGSILKDIHKRYVMFQVLNATNFIHSGNIIHRDLKPSNILVDSKCRCKLADFGLARSLSQNHPTVDSNGNEETCLTDYVATRWYRAPEILIANKQYTKGIDMWSLGCILGEMCRGKPLFPGSCTINQIECILSALPLPTESDLKSVGNGFGSALLSQSSKSINSNPNMEELLADTPGDAKDLVRSLLVMDPTKRLTAKQALCHKYVEKFRNSTPELELTADIVPPFRDDIQLTVSEYRSKLYEIMSIAEKKRNSTSSPSGVSNSKSSPTDSLRKVPLSSSSNSRTILPKTITTNTSVTDKKVPTNANYSTQKYPNDAKHHPSYSSVFHSKPIPNTKPTSIQQQSTTVQPRQVNGTGSYARLTNKLNCCKSCVREPDTDALVKRCANDVLIPKLKNDTKYPPSQYIDSNANCCYESEQEPKYKMPSEARRSTIPGAYRRPSNDANAMLRKSTFKRSLDEDLLHAGDFRQSSFDAKSTTNTRLLKKLTPPQPEYQSEFQRNGNGAYLSQSMGKHIVNASNENRRLIKQKSLDDYTDATARLRKLEMKMRKHKIDVLKYANDHDEPTIYATDPKKLLAYPPSNHFRNKLESFARTKADCVYPKIGIDSVLSSKTPAFRKNGSNGNSYGIITSSDLYKLRGTPERVT